MKIIIEIDGERRFMLEAPTGFFLENLPKVFEGLELAQKIAKKKPDPAPPVMPKRFRCSMPWWRTVERKVLAADAFAAAESFAQLIMPSPGERPWVHLDRDYEKLRHFGDRFSHRVGNGHGKTISVAVKEVR